MAIVTVLNQKGGVGKTSATFHLGGALAESGRRVLLVDADPQASLTQGLFGPRATRAIPPAETIAAVLAGALPAVDSVVREAFPGVAIVPGGRSAARSNVPEPHAAPWEAQVALREFLAEAGGYDVILIDCPPNLHLCSWSGLVAADAVVVPLQPEDYGAQGIADVNESIAAVQAGPNPGLALAGYLLSLYIARRAMHRYYEQELRELYGSAVFAAVIPMAADFPEAIGQRKTIIGYKPRSAAARAIRAVAEELMSRLSAHGRARSRTVAHNGGQAA